MDYRKELKLIWLVKVAQHPHYGCEYRQDGLPRDSVRCAGCSHSKESSNQAVRNVVDFVAKTVGKQS